MTSEETQMLLETHTDVKWIKETLVSHLAAHMKVGLAIAGAIVSVVGGCLVYHFTQ